MDLKIIDYDPNIKYKREIWLGVRPITYKVNLFGKFWPDYDTSDPRRYKSIWQVLAEEPRLFPALLEYESKGERHYVAVDNLNRGTKAVNTK